MVMACSGFWDWWAASNGPIILKQLPKNYKTTPKIYWNNDQVTTKQFPNDYQIIAMAKQCLNSKLSTDFWRSDIYTLTNINPIRLNFYVITSGN